LCADDGRVVRAERFLHKRFSPPWEISIWRARLPSSGSARGRRRLPRLAQFHRKKVSAFRHGGTSIDTEEGARTTTGPKTRNVLPWRPCDRRGDASGPIKITLHYENGGVVAEANFSTELCGTLENVGRERFR